jgi:hypothetical protein
MIFYVLILIILLILIIINFKSDFADSDMKLYDIAYELGINYLNVIDYSGLSNPAVMFDIDDTLLKVPGKPGGKFKPIRPIIKLLNECRRRGLIIIIITARDSIFTRETKQDLSDFNIKYDYLYLRQSPRDDYQLFKSDIKKSYHENGINIIMSVGDNEIDIVGTYSGYGIKLPNRQDPKLYHITYNGILENVVP